MGKRYTMSRLFSYLLRNYDEKDFVLYLKANFLIKLLLAIIPLTVMVFTYTVYLQLYEPEFQHRLSLGILIPEFSALIVLAFIFFILTKGYFTFAAHSTMIASMATVWSVMFLDNGGPVAKLDSIVFLVGLLAALPIILSRNGRPVFLYTGINVFILFLFIFFSKEQLGLLQGSIIDYLADNTIGFVFVGMVAYQVFSINQKALLRVESDIQERKLAEEALRDSEEKYRTVVENANEAILILQGNQFKYFNPKTCELTGYTAEELLTTTFFEIVHPDDQEMIIDKYARRQVGVIRDETYSFRVTGKQGNIIWAEIKPVIISWGGETATLCFISDVTERKRSAELMIQTEKMMSVGGLAAGMAHELNNPLGGMLQGIQNVQRRLSPTVEANIQVAAAHKINLNDLQGYLKERNIFEFFQGVTDSGLRAAKIIKDMLLFSRKSESEMALVSLIELMENVLDLAGKDYDLKKKYDFRNITIIKQYDSNLPPVPCAETEIEQVILNLLKNAAQAMTEESQKENPQITIRLLKDQGWLRIEIEDNGPGFGEDIRKRIFEPFYTTKPVGEGTGLGLSVSYMIITNNHQGTMEVESEFGKGTKFIIQLPLDIE